MEKSDGRVVQSLKKEENDDEDEHSNINRLFS